MGHFRVPLNLIVKARPSAVFVSFNSYANNFHVKSFALSLAFIMGYSRKNPHPPPPTDGVVF